MRLWAIDQNFPIFHLLKTFIQYLAHYSCFFEFLSLVACRVSVNGNSCSPLSLIAWCISVNDCTWLRNCRPKCTWWRKIMLCDLLGSVQAQVQDIARFVWNKSEESNLGTGFTSIEKMIGDRSEVVQVRSRVWIHVSVFVTSQGKNSQLQWNLKLLKNQDCDLGDVWKSCLITIENHVPQLAIFSCFMQIQSVPD